MKVIFVACMLLASLNSFALENKREDVNEKEKSSVVDVDFKTKTINSESDIENEEFECSITSSGTVETSTGSFEATLTVTGPCDASLAEKMREAIRVLRASFN